MKNPKLVEAVKVMREVYWSSLDLVSWSDYYSVMSARSAFRSGYYSVKSARLAYRSGYWSASLSANISSKLDKEKVLKIIKEKYEQSKIG